MKKIITNLIIQSPKGKYLLQMRDGGAPTYPLQWAFFGGKIETGEDPLKSAIREFEEELGVLSNPEDFSSIKKVDDYDDARIRHLAFYIPRLSWKNIVIKEGAGGAFFTKEEILQINSTPGTKNVVQNHLP